MAEVTMPKLSDSMEEGTVVQWLLDDGADVTVGDELVEIETDKANMIYEAEAAGTLKITVPEGTTLRIGATIAYIGPAAPDGERRDATPLKTLPSGEGQSSPKDGRTRQTLTSVQAAIARRMVEAKATMPDFTLTMDIDMGGVVDARTGSKKSGNKLVPSLNDFVVKACAQTLRRHPRVNGAFQDGAFELYDRIMIGVAVAAENALLVPVIADADQRSMSDIAAESKRLADEARAGRLHPNDVCGGTFTVSNLGMYGVTSFTAVLNPPQAAILAVGALQSRPAVVDGDVVVRPRMTVTLTCDHRILYGADAAEFLRDVRNTLEEPSGLLDTDPEG